VAVGEVDDNGEGHRDRADADVVPADVSADDPDVFCLGSLLALGDVELDPQAAAARTPGTEPGARHAGIGLGELARQRPRAPAPAGCLRLRG
jgi:hypothetical protein